MRGEEGEKIIACTHSIVQAVPAFKNEYSCPIGYFTSREPRMLRTTAWEATQSRAGI